LEEQGVAVDGFLSPAVFKDGAPVGYDLYDLKEKETRPYIRKEGEKSWEKEGRYFFIPEGLEKAKELIRRHRKEDFLVVDEAGPLEIEGRGLWPALGAMLSDPSLRCLLVVRKNILEEFRKLLDPFSPNIFDIEVPDSLARLRQGIQGSEGAKSIKIKIKFLAYFRDLFGSRAKEVSLPEGAQLRDLLRVLCNSPESEKNIFAEKEKLNPQAVILKNGAPVQSSGGLDATLADGDVIAILPFLGGG
jgi:MoaD family protein